MKRVKNITITLDDEDVELLERICCMTERKRTEVVRSALRLYYNFLITVVSKGTVRGLDER